MKIMVVFVSFILMTGSIAHAKDYEVNKKAGEYDVAAMIDRNPPIVGDNNIRIDIKDASGKDVTDAKVTIEYSMPAMPGMPAMNYSTGTELKGNEYKALLHLPNAGSWTVTIKIARTGRTASAKFVLNVK